MMCICFRCDFQLFSVLVVYLHSIYFILIIVIFLFVSRGFVWCASFLFPVHRAICEWIWVYIWVQCVLCSCDTMKNKIAYHVPACLRSFICCPPNRLALTAKSHTKPTRILCFSLLLSHFLGDWIHHIKTHKNCLQLHGLSANAEHFFLVFINANIQEK